MTHRFKICSVGLARQLRWMTLGLCAFGLSAAGLVACSANNGATNSVAESEQAIISGNDASSEVLPEGHVFIKTLKIKIINGSLEAVQELGTGILLNNEWVLTAAHVVASADNPGQVTVALGSTSSATSVVASNLFIHPLYRRGLLPNPTATDTQPLTLDNVDMALVKLSSPLNASVSYNRRISAFPISSLVGGFVDCYGYGRFARDNASPSTNLRKSHNLVGPAPNPFATTFEILQNTDGQIPDHGDSGGSCLLGNEVAGLVRGNFAIPCASNAECPLDQQTGLPSTCRVHPGDTDATCDHVKELIQSAASFRGFVRATLREPATGIAGTSDSVTIAVNPITKTFEITTSLSGVVTVIPTTIPDPTGGDAMAQVEVANYNGDAIPDLVFLFQTKDLVTNQRASFGFVVTGPSDPLAWVTAIANAIVPNGGASLLVNDSATFVMPEDADGDGDQDIVVVNQSGTIDTFFNNSSTISNTPARTLLGDITGDGTLDRVFLTKNASTNKLRWTARSEMPDAAQDTTVNFVEPVEAFMADFDGDGDSDIGLLSNGQQYYIRAAGGGGFGGVVFATDNQYTDISVSDVDGNGIMDFEAARTNGEVRAYLGTKNAQLGATPTVLNGIPSANSNDGKFLVLGGRDLQTVVDSKLDLFISEPVNATGTPTGKPLIIQVFDADSESLNDNSNNEPQIRTCLKLIPDPNPGVIDDDDCRLEPGDEGSSVCTNFTKAQDESDYLFVDNGWWTFFNTAAGDAHDDRARLTSTSPRWYRLEVTLGEGCYSPPAAGSGGTNAFKVRTTGQIRTAQAITIIGRDLIGPYAAQHTVPTVDNKFDGTVDIRFFVGNGTSRFFVSGAPAPSGITLSQADADDTDLGGIADGKTPNIFFELYAGEPGASTPVHLDRTKGVGPDPGPVTRVEDPSGNYSGANPEFEEHKLTDPLVTGMYTWHWGEVLTENAIHLLPAAGSPVVHEFVASSGTWVSSSTARSPSAWIGSADLPALLPVAAGQSALGQYVKVTTAQQAAQVLSQGDQTLTSTFVRELVALKLNLRYAETKGEPLGAAKVLSSEYTVARLVDEAETALRRGATDSSVALLAQLLGTANDGRVSFLSREVLTFGQTDGDGDAVADTLDNCPNVANPTQADANFDGRGDACEPKPTVSCVHQLSDRYVAVFGYVNGGAEMRVMPGTVNQVTGGTVLGSQPVLFESGAHDNALLAEFSGTSVTWSLFDQQVSASSSSPRCPIAPGTPSCLEKVGGLACCTGLSTCSTASAFGLYATDGIVLADRVRVLDSAGAPAPVMSRNGSLSLGVEAQVGSAVVGGNVILRDRSKVLGDVVASGVLQRGNDTVVSGGIEQLKPVVGPDLSEFAVPMTAGSTDITLGVGVSATRAPGAYKNVHLYSDAVLRLSSGTYYMSSLMLEPKSRFALDTTLGPVTIHVAGSVTLRGTVPTAGAGLVLIHHSNDTLSLEGPFDGTVISPNGTLVLQTQGAPFLGSYFAKRIEVFAGCVIQTHLPKPSILGAQGPLPVCGNGRIEFREACDDGNTTNGDGCNAACLLEGALCSESAAIDLGGTGLYSTVPNNGCLRIRDGYPANWGTRSLNLQSAGSGTYPVPFTWRNACAGSNGTGQFTGNWQVQTFGPTNSACATLIQLAGTGQGSISVGYF